MRLLLILLYFDFWQDFADAKRQIHKFGTTFPPDLERKEAKRKIYMFEGFILNV